MKRNAKRKLLNGCLAAAVTLTTLSPLTAGAAVPGVPNAVDRIGGYDQYATAALIAQKGWTGTCDSVVLSAGTNYALVDALAAGPLAAALKAPILLTDDGQSLNPSAKAELLRLKPKKVYITSGTAVIKQSVLNEITAMGVTPVQLGGYDQYETSVNIAKEMANQGVDITQVMVAAGWLSPADALSIAPIAAANGMPILTTTQGQLPSSVKTYLDSLKDKVTDSYVVGGTVVVSDAVKGQLPGNVKRYSGLTKYDTNVEILKGLAKKYKNDKVYVANGETLVDALSVVPLAAASGSPVVLAHQQLSNATKDFVKLNMSTDDMVAVGGETVLPTAEMNALTSAAVYATDGEAVGSASAADPLELTDNVKLTGDNITLQNAAADYSVYVKGDNITLNNLTVKGTVFVDPGDTGTATLDGVTAARIVVLSGASDSIHIKNTTAGVLTVDSSSNVHVEATGTTMIGDTVVRTYAILDANGGSLGEVSITNTPGQEPVVELRGTFKEPVVVEGQVTLKAAANAVIPSVVVRTENPNQKVTLVGSFKSVEVQSQGKLALGEGTVVETMKTTAKVDITIPSSSSIGTLDVGSTGTLVSGGGKVNGQQTGTTPSAPPAGNTDKKPSSGGGGGSSGGGNDVDTTTDLDKFVNNFAVLLGTYGSINDRFSLDYAKGAGTLTIKNNNMKTKPVSSLYTAVVDKIRDRGITWTEMSLLNTKLQEVTFNGASFNTYMVNKLSNKPHSQAAVSFFRDPSADTFAALVTALANHDEYSELVDVLDEMSLLQGGKVIPQPTIGGQTLQKILVDNDASHGSVTGEIETGKTYTIAEVKEQLGLSGTVGGLTFSDISGKYIGLKFTKQTYWFHIN